MRRIGKQIGQLRVELPAFGEGSEYSQRDALLARHYPRRANGCDFGRNSRISETDMELEVRGLAPELWADLPGRFWPLQLARFCSHCWY